MMTALASERKWRKRTCPSARSAGSGGSWPSGGKPPWWRAFPVQSYPQCGYALVRATASGKPASRVGLCFLLRRGVEADHVRPSAIGDVGCVMEVDPPTGRRIVGVRPSGRYRMAARCLAARAADRSSASWADPDGTPSCGCCSAAWPAPRTSFPLSRPLCGGARLARRRQRRTRRPGPVPP